MILHIISYAFAEILLVDDLGLKNTTDGMRSLQNMTNAIQKNFGEPVNIIRGSPPQLNQQRAPLSNLLPKNMVIPIRKTLKNPNNPRRLSPPKNFDPIARRHVPPMAAPFANQAYQKRGPPNQNRNVPPTTPLFATPLSNMLRGIYPPATANNQALQGPTPQQPSILDPLITNQSSKVMLPTKISIAIEESKPSNDTSPQSVLRPSEPLHNPTDVDKEIDEALFNGDFKSRASETTTPKTNSSYTYNNPFLLTSSNTPSSTYPTNTSDVVEISTPLSKKPGKRKNSKNNNDLPIQSPENVISSVFGSNIPHKTIDQDSSESTPKENKPKQKGKKQPKPSSPDRSSVPAKTYDVDLLDSSSSETEPEQTTTKKHRPKTSTSAPQKRKSKNSFPLRFNSDKKTPKKKVKKLYNEDSSDSVPIEITTTVKSTRTRNKTTTKTMTVTETEAEPDIRTLVTPIFTQIPSYLPSLDQIITEREEVSKVVVPRLRGKQFISKHNTDIASADKARISYLGYKLEESKEKRKKIEGNLDSLKELEEKLASKLNKITNERFEINQKASTAKNFVENNEGTVKTLEDEEKKNERLMKLGEVEIGKLEKALSEEKNKYLILSDQRALFKDRVNSFGKKGYDTKTDMKINESKLAEYDKLLAQIQSNHENLQNKIEEVERQRRREIDAQNRLEIEKKEIEDGQHIPLFADYD